MWNSHRLRLLVPLSAIPPRSCFRSLRPVLPLPRKLLLTRCVSSHASTENFIFPSIYSDVTVPDVSLTQYILDEQEKYADKIGLINGETDEKWTHGEIRSRINRFASALSRLGVSKGDTVAIISANCPEFILSFFAVSLLGAVVSTFNSTYTSSEISAQLLNSESHYVICHQDKLQDVKEACKGKDIRHILCIGQESDGVLSVQKLIKQDDGKGIPNNIQITPSKDLVVLPYSSGTTGLPKGVMLTHRNVVANMQQIQHPEINVLKPTTDDYQERMIALIPLYHIYGMVTCMCQALISGGCVITMKEFKKETYISTIQKHQVTCLHLVPPLMSFLATSKLAAPDLLSPVQKVFCGAAPLGKTLWEDFTGKFGNKFLFSEGYGMTEASPVTHISRHGKIIIGSCGPAIPNTWSKIIDFTTKEPLPPGKEGELCVKGPQVMKGYYNNEKATLDTIDKEGWLHTGDIAVMDDELNVFIVDRLKELIKVKGLQVAPAELENLLRKHPDVEDVAVTGIPDERAGELPRAFIVPVKGKNITEKEIKDFVAEQVAHYKRLDGGVVFLDEIPKSAAGKILRRELKKLI